MINATARKYKVERSDVYQAKQIAEELIGITLPTVTILASVMVATAAMLVSVKLKKAREERSSDKET